MLNLRALLFELSRFESVIPVVFAIAFFLIVMRLCRVNVPCFHQNVAALSPEIYWGPLDIAPFSFASGDVLLLNSRYPKLDV